MQSPAFSNFRHLMDKWDVQLAMEAEKISIGDHLDGQNLILFFKRGDDIFGAPEESRLVFAKLKSKDDDEDMPPTWRDEAKFIAMNLIQSLVGQPTENMFGIKDLANLKLLDREKVVAALMKSKNKKNKKDKKK